MPALPASIAVTAIAGASGFQLTSNSGSDRLEGMAVGDFNGDAILDYVAAAPTSTSYAGSVYVIFGTVGAPAVPLDITTLDGTNGFRIRGEASNDRAGYAVASVGDINGDGLDDLVLGARENDGGGDNAGAVYVIYGRDDGGFTAELQLSALTAADGSKIVGGSQDKLGTSVNDLGDVNGDGIGDFLMVAGSADTGGSNAGEAYVVFGRTGDLPTGVTANALIAGGGGFRILGKAGDLLNSSGRAGDVDGDGLQDIILGTPFGAGDGRAWVIYGKDDDTADIDLGALTSDQGYRIDGGAVNHQFGTAVGTAGDLNNDGFDDVVVGDFQAEHAGPVSGAAYVIFGSATRRAGPVVAANLDGTDGFRVDGPASSSQRLGEIVGPAGDFNNDGYEDLLVATRFTNPGALNAAGGVYVVFGHAGGFGATLSVSDFNGVNGLLIHGTVASQRLGSGAVATGDLNGDGIDDISFSSGGFTNASTWVAYGIQGDLTLTGTAGNDGLTGKSGDDHIFGLSFNDVLSGLGGIDTLDGGAGGDIIDGGEGDDLLTGGDGSDKLFGGNGADQLTGGTGLDRMDGGAGIDTLTGGDGNDYLDGGAGADILIGGLGNDVFLIDNAADTATEAADEGYDIVRTALDGWVLGANFEALELQGSADIDGTGNSGANNLQGNAGANRLDGGAGVDTLNGNDGDDIIVGGLGNDLLRGGIGADVFTVGHVASGTLETDLVYDFNAAEGDIIDLSGAYGGTLALVAGFTKQAGQMTLSFAGGITTLRIDTTGDGKVDYQMKLNGDVTGESADWLL